MRTYKETCGTDGVREIIRAGRIDRVLGILLRLRQLSNSPALLTADPPPVAAAAEKRGPGTARKASLGGGADGDEPSVRALLAGSGKLRLFVRLVRVLRAEGARILVFSQVRSTVKMGWQADLGPLPGRPPPPAVGPDAGPPRRCAPGHG